MITFFHKNEICLFHSFPYLCYKNGGGKYNKLAKFLSADCFFNFHMFISIDFHLMLRLVEIVNAFP